MNSEEPQYSDSIIPQYRTYQRQKCFIACTQATPWSVELMDACKEILNLPEFNLEADYAGKHFDPDVTLRQKARELIANARYGLYDLSYWKDAQCNWQMPRNVLIELGMAIALNRPTLLLRHVSNRVLELPDCLKSISSHIIEFGGEFTLKNELKRRLPQWLNAPPERDWWNRYCIFGNRSCEFREAHPRSRQWGHRELHCHISDGSDPDSPDFRLSIEKVLERFSDITFSYLGALPIAKGYDFLLCTHCQTIRSTSFAIYRITQYTPAETFIAIGMNIALEDQFGYKIPKLLLTEKVEDLPSLLSGYEVFVARNNKDVKDHLLRFMPAVMQKVRETVWKPKPLPFIDIDIKPIESEVEEDSLSEQVKRLIQSGEKFDKEGKIDLAIGEYNRAVEIEPNNPHLHMRLGEIYDRLARYKEAEECFKKASSLDPSNLTTLTILGNTQLKTGDHREARLTFEQALSLDFNSVAAKIGLAEAAKIMRDYSTASNMYKEAVALSPNNLAARIGLADLLLSQKNPSEAEQIYREIISQFPDNIVAFNGLADTLKYLRRYEEAERIYQEIITRFPNDVIARNGLAGLLLAQNKNSQAEQLYLDTLKLFPDNNEARSGLEALQKSRSGVRRSKVRLYDLAKELKLETKRLIEEVRREGVDVSVPSNQISKELADKIRNKYFPKKEVTLPRVVRVVKRAERPAREDLDDAKEARTQTIPIRDKAREPTSSAFVVKPLKPIAHSQIHSGLNSEQSVPERSSLRNTQTGSELSQEQMDQGQDKSSKIYVGNLPFNITSSELLELFSQMGTVESASIVEDRETGRSRGFGFVDMATPEEATNAIKQLNNIEFRGRRLRISEARPRA